VAIIRAFVAIQKILIANNCINLIAKHSKYEEGGIGCLLKKDLKYYKYEKQMCGCPCRFPQLALYYLSLNF